MSPSEQDGRAAFQLLVDLANERLSQMGPAMQSVLKPATQNAANVVDKILKNYGELSHEP